MERHVFLSALMQTLSLWHDHDDLRAVCVDSYFGDVCICAMHACLRVFSRIMCSLITFLKVNFKSFLTGDNSILSSSHSAWTSSVACVFACALHSHRNPFQRFSHSSKLLLSCYLPSVSISSHQLTHRALTYILLVVLADAIMTMVTVGLMTVLWPRRAQTSSKWIFTCQSDSMPSISMDRHFLAHFHFLQTGIEHVDFVERISHYPAILHFTCFLAHSPPHVR